MKVPLLATALLALALGATETQADDWRGFDRGRGPERVFSGGYRGFTPPGHYRKRDWDRDRRSRVTVNLNVNRNWPRLYTPYNSFNYVYRGDNWSLGLGTWTRGFDPWPRNTRRPVVINNTYIDSHPRTTSTTISRGTSLLRTLDGRCYERSTDRNGNELRTELPRAACSF